MGTGTLTQTNKPSHFISPRTRTYFLQWLLAFATGAITVAAFAPFDLGLIALGTLALLFHMVWQSESPWRAAGLGYAFGLGLMGFGVFWIQNSIAQFGGVDPVMALAATLGFVAVAGLYYALFAGLLKRLGRNTGKWAFMLWLVPLVWVVVEWVRSWLFTGFPWLSIGYSQIDLPLAGYAPLFGVLGVSIMLAWSAALITLTRSLWSLVILCLIWCGGWALQQIEWTSAYGEPFQASLIQGNINQDDKWKPGQMQRTLKLYQDLTQQAADSRLVVWPETAIPSFDIHVEEALLQPLHQQMQQQQRDLLTGIVVKKPDGRYYNAMISLGISGRDEYFKRHLVPFGEYIPIKSVFGPLLDFIQIPMSNFSPGDNQDALIMLAGHQAGINICYEDAFGLEVLRALPQAAYLVNASNDSWFGDSLAPHQHLQIARMRALESQRYLLRATSTGVSAIVDHLGKIRQSAPQFTQATVTAPVQPRQGVTPYAFWGDVPLMLLAIGGLLIWRSRHRTQRQPKILLKRPHPIKQEKQNHETDY